MLELLIFPYSGTAIEALDCLGDEWRCIGFVSDDPKVVGKSFFGIEVFDRSAFLRFNTAKVLAVHGSPQSFDKRAGIVSSLQLPQERFARVIHPKASVSPRAVVGTNVLMMAGVVITANATVGSHVVILPNTVVHHDSTIGDYCLLAANVTVAGYTSIGHSCYLGASSSIKNGISIGAGSLVGMGANVVRTFPEHSILIGNPAKEK